MRRFKLKLRRNAHVSITSRVVGVSSTQALYFRSNVLLNLASIGGVNDTIALARATSETQASEPIPTFNGSLKMVVVHAIDLLRPGKADAHG